MTRPAVFLDRDGVLVPDKGFLTRPEEVELFSYAADAVKQINDLGVPVFVITNQAVVARGLASCEDVERIHHHIATLLAKQGNARVEQFYFCPHHPDADMEAYRENCACRKPRGGMLQQAAADWDLDLPQSFMIGDRPSDMQAGKSVGCTTILLETGKHTDAPIVSDKPLDEESTPDYRCADLREAVALLTSLLETMK